MGEAKSIGPASLRRAAAAAAALAIMGAASVISAGGFGEVRGWGPLALGTDLPEARAALEGARIAHREKFVMKDGTTRILLEGDGGRGVCYFDEDGRLGQIVFTGPVMKSPDEVAAVERRAIERHGPPHETAARTYPDEGREDRELTWRNAVVEFTLTEAHTVSRGEWVVFETYAPAP